MKLQNLTIIFIIIVLPVILLTTFYISTGLKTIKYQALYDTGLITATQDAIQAFELNSLNNKYSGNAETKRSIIKSSVKMLETSLCSTCNISSYNTDEIEEYIPAIMFGLSDGFYVYAPSLNPTTNEYEHSLKSYVYYSESLTGNTSDGVVIYHLDSYVEISGYFNGSYESQEGYLINADKVVFEWDGNEYKYKDTTYPIENFYKEYKKELAKDKDDRDLSKFSITYYNNTEIDMYDQLAVNYFVDNYKFSKWFDETVISNIDASTTSSKYAYLKVIDTNDPEDPESEFSKHKKELIKSKIEGVLNSTITAYSKRNYGQEYKMPKLSEEDWEKIYTDVSVTTFFQGKKIGLTKYNGYCVLNSNNNYETINPNLLYFSTDGDATNSSDDDGKINTTSDYYHDIRCSELKELTDTSTKEVSTGITTIRGWKIGRFQKIKTQDDATEYNSDSTEVTTERTYTKYNKYMYERAELACYSCINGSVGNTSVYDYIAVANSSSHTGNTTNTFIKESYWTSLARERAKLHDDEAEIPSNLSITKSVAGIEEGTYNDPDGVLTVINGSQVKYTITVTNNVAKTDTINIKDDFDLDSGKISGNATVKSYNADNTLIYEYGNTQDFSTFELQDLSIAPNGKIEIIYNANITDKDGDDEVINTATVTAEEFSKSATATCNVLKSDIGIEKSISDKDGNKITTLEKGGDAYYTITITNNNSLIDKVNIEDMFDSKIEIDTDSISTPGIGKSYERDGTTIKWSNVTLVSSVTIKYKAKIKGDIGQSVTNTARVKSVYTGAMEWKEASATCSVEKTINLKGEGGSDFHVYLVLDASTSVSGQLDNIKKAANSFISTVGADKVTIIRFAQTASPIDSMSEYKVLLEGMSTNYLGGLQCTIDNIKNSYRENSVNYVVFMSDGGPTNTQTTAYEVKIGNEPSGFSLILILKVIVETIGKTLVEMLTAIYGGWIESDWTDVNEYKAHLLLPDGFAAIWNSAADLYNKYFSRGENNAPKIGSLGIKDDVVAPEVWKKIMNKVDELKKITKQVYTVYFQVGDDNDPEYGIRRMASDYNETAFKSTNGTMLNTHFEKIANDIKSYNIDKSVTSSSGEITIDMYEKISDIQIGGTSVTASQLELIKSKITGNADGTGTLDLKDSKIASIFNTDKEIKILY